MQLCAVLVEVEHFSDGGDASVATGVSLRMEETFKKFTMTPESAAVTSTCQRGGRLHIQTD